jgi:hypothetical protein
MRLTEGLAKACTLLASPLNKNIFVVRLGRKSHYILTAFAKPERCTQFGFDSVRSENSFYGRQIK